ncbi:MAG: hypothetical protein GY820_23460 [Gammaproteobacteria bacterium]|nr:hypothetical protein [Gammaproteobacteria bacterium]
MRGRVSRERGVSRHVIFAQMQRLLSGVEKAEVRATLIGRTAVEFARHVRHAFACYRRLKNRLVVKTVTGMSGNTQIFQTRQPIVGRRDLALIDAHNHMPFRQAPGSIQVRNSRQSGDNYAPTHSITGPEQNRSHSKGQNTEQCQGQIVPNAGAINFQFGQGTGREIFFFFVKKRFIIRNIHVE